MIRIPSGSSRWNRLKLAWEKFGRTLLTLLMAPILVVMYTRLANEEERELQERFGEAYRAYRLKVPAFWPRWVKEA